MCKWGRDRVVLMSIWNSIYSSVLLSVKLYFKNRYKLINYFFLWGEKSCGIFIFFFKESLIRKVRVCRDDF